MINLLPPDRASQIRYGRINSVLRRWIIAAAAAILVLIIILASGFVYINQQANSLRKDISSSQQQLKAEGQAKTESEAKLITSDIRLINQVLSSEVRFSDLMVAIGKVMPSGAVLSGLTLGNINGAIDISANTQSYAPAAQIAVNLADPTNDIFTHVDIISISCDQSKVGISQYPCTGVFKALFSKSAANKFLVVVPKGSAQ